MKPRFAQRRLTQKENAMSDELIFDSERQLLRAGKRRRLILLLILTGVVVLGVVIALILLSRRPALHTGGEDTPYPYAWQTLANGSLQLQISHDDAPDDRWIASLEEEDEDPVVSIAPAGQKQTTAVFTFQPRREGRCSVALTLQSSEETPQLRFRQSLLLEVTGAEKGLQATVLSSHGILLQTDAKGGGGTENPYRAYYETDGDLVVSVGSGAQEKDWSCELLSGQDAITFLGLSYEEQEVRAYFRAGNQAGDSELLLQSEAAAVTLRLQCSTSSEGTLQIVGHTADYGEKPPKTEFTDLVEQAISSDLQGDDSAP